MFYSYVAKDEYIYFPTAVLSEDGLAILLKDTPNHFGLGQQLGMDDGLLEALFSHFKNNPLLLVNHMMGMWLMEDPEDAAKQLSEALIAVGDRDIATRLQLLSHLGEKSVHVQFLNILCLMVYIMSPISASINVHRIFTKRNK